MSQQTNDTLEEIARFTGKACAIIARDLADLSQSFTVAFRAGWRETMEEKPKPAPAAQNHAPESA
ncbi:MAG: hypothetical protein ACRD5I_06265 [Candidatus Acidiferrales bacterium]